MEDVNSKDYVSVKDAKRMLGISYMSLIRWDASKKIRTIRTPTNRRMFNFEDIQKILDTKTETTIDINKKKIAYIRISYVSQTNKLKVQTDFYKIHYPDFNIIVDVSSKLNLNRKGLKRILDLSMAGKIENVIILNFDAIPLCAFDIFKFILRKNNTSLKTLNKEIYEIEKSEEAEDSEEVNEERRLGYQRRNQ